MRAHALRVITLCFLMTGLTALTIPARAQDRPGLEVVYQTDFSEEPIEWTTDNPNSFYWDPDVQAYRFDCRAPSGLAWCTTPLYQWYPPWTWPPPSTRLEFDILLEAMSLRSVVVPGLASSHSWDWFGPEGPGTEVWPEGRLNKYLGGAWADFTVRESVDGRCFGDDYDGWPFGLPGEYSDWPFWFGDDYWDWECEEDTWSGIGLQTQDACVPGWYVATGAKLEGHPWPDPAEWYHCVIEVVHKPWTWSYSTTLIITRRSNDALIWTGQFAIGYECPPRCDTVVLGAVASGDSDDLHAEALSPSVAGYLDNVVLYAGFLGGSAPTASFTYEPVEPIAGEVVRFTDTSTDPDGDIAGWSWNFGDGTSSSVRHPQHAYQQPGTYAVTLTVRDSEGRTDRASTEIVVLEPPLPNAPLAAFTYEPAHPSILDTVQFHDRSTDADNDIVSWYWEFGDGGSCYCRNPRHRYESSGTYTVSLTVTDDDGHSDRATAKISVVSPPTAAFTCAPEVVLKNEEVSFADRSTDPDSDIVSWRWNFGDGGSSTQRNPDHTYTRDGEYTVTLTVMDATGLSDSATHKVYVEPLLRYEWLPPDPPKALMNRNFEVRLRVQNPSTRLAQQARFSLNITPAQSFPAGWDPGWRETLLLNGKKYQEGHTETGSVPASTSRTYHFTINIKWNWIEPYVVAGRLVDIALRVWLAYPGLKAWSYTYTVVKVIFDVVPSVTTLTFRCEGTGSGAVQIFQLPLSVPPEKYLLYFDSVLAGVLGSHLTTAGFAALLVPGFGWAVAGPLFVGEAIEIGLGEVAYFFAVDPDPDYARVNLPEGVVIPTVDELESAEGRMAVSALLDALSYLRAAKDSYACYEAAEDAEDAPWVNIQLTLTRAYLAQAAWNLREAGRHYMLLTAGLPDPGAAEVEQIRRDLEANGLPQIEVETLLALGYTRADIDTITAALMKLPDDAFRGLSNVPEVYFNVASGLGSIAEAMPLSPAGLPSATLDVDPDTLQLRSKGKWVTAYVQLAEGFSVKDVGVSSLRLQGQIPAEAKPIEIGDHNGDGVPDLMLKFNRQQLADLLAPGRRVIVLSGRLKDGTPFAATDVIRVINGGKAQPKKRR